MTFLQQLRIGLVEAAHVLQGRERKAGTELCGQARRQVLQQSLPITGALGTALLGLDDLLADQPVGAHMSRVDRTRCLRARAFPDAADAREQFGRRRAVGGGYGLERGLAARHAASPSNSAACPGDAALRPRDALSASAAGAADGCAIGKLATFRL